MRKFRAKRGRFDVQVHYSLAHIDQVCSDALASVGCLPEEPQAIRVDRFLEKRFCDIAYEDLVDGVLGCTIFDSNGKVQAIIISKSIEDGTRPGERRLRSTLAHEGGHCLLHAHLFVRGELEQGQFGFEQAENKIEDRILCRGGDIGGADGRRPYDGKWWEFQANRAIGGLLLPKKLVTMLVEKTLGVTGATVTIPDGRRDEVVREVSEVFDVNPAVARIRVNEIWRSSAEKALF